tara:strand:+ start:309 stop:692 length:384 start_codon:yes stop_codon:yes gene_type:complete
MRIFGVGTDIVKVKRLKKTIKKKLFLSRLFNNDEVNKCKKSANSLNCFAKRFAAKEAFSKAFGTGISKGINFNEIIVLNEKNGKPYIKLLDKTKKIVEKKLKKKKYKISLSIADEKDYAVAFVTITI